MLSHSLETIRLSSPHDVQLTRISQLLRRRSPFSVELEKTYKAFTCYDERGPRLKLGQA